MRRWTMPARIRCARWEELNGSELIADEVNFDLSRDDVERANRLHRLYQAIERLPGTVPPGGQADMPE